MTKTFALIKERKTPPDRRVVFSPEKCVEIVKKFPHIRIIVESSDIRVFPDEDYRSLGFEVLDDVSEADVMLGVKEVPIEHLIPNKKYFFFSHTIKEQPYNRGLLQAILENKIELTDHETIVNEQNRRLIGFGYYAGLVGAYNGFRMLGLRDNLFALPKMETLATLSDAQHALDQIGLPNLKIILSGTGKVTQGAKAVLNHLKIRQVDVDSYLTQDFDEPVYCMIGVEHYNKRVDGSAFDKKDFYANPLKYESNFMRFAKVSDMFITGHFYGTDAPYLFTREDARDPDFRIHLLADVSCDIDGPIAATIRPSTIADPFYGYDPQTEKEVPYDTPGAIAVMAVDNLPCELPNDASVGFGDMFETHVLPAFFNGDKDGILERARITTSAGGLTPRFSYLKDYVSSLV